MTPDERASQASNAYADKFGDFPPYPVGVEPSFYAETLWQHIAKGTPLPEDFDFYPDKPEDALA